MAEKDLIDRGTTRRPAPAVSVVSAPSSSSSSSAPPASSSVTPAASPVTPVVSGTATVDFGGAAGEPWWLPGVVGGSASGEPGWAVFAREAVASAPCDVVVADRAYPGLSGFGPVVAPFVEAATRRLRDALTENGPAADGSSAVLADFRRQLTRRLSRIAGRTLVTELHEARRLGRLRGEGPEERFRDFVRRTARRDGLALLVTGYPVLARLLATACLNAGDAFAEMAARLAADRHLLAPSGVLGARAGSPEGGLGGNAGPGALTGVEAGAGDSHRGGRSVMLLRFADGARLVYKPRPLAAHRHFNTLAEWFGSLPGAPELRVLRVLDRGDYGWAEFVEERPCSTAAETRQFYRRQGALLALLHTLDGTDLHHENLIACGPHPVLVDVETLFHPPLGPARSTDPAARALHDSVHRVGLLPQLLVGDTTALDMSAIGGGRAASSPIETADWAEAGTDRMRLVRRAGRFTESANRPRLGGVAAAPSAYTDALCGGFRAGYTAISDHRAELLGEDGLLRLFARDEVRVVPRPTWTYTTLLDESTHPDLMRDATERHQVLSLLRTPLLGVPALPGVEDEEVAELWCGDVPVFGTRPGSTELWSGTGHTVPASRTAPGPDRDPAAGDADGPTGLARVEAKVRAMDTVDRQDQERIIRAAMVSTSPEPPHRAGPGGRSRSAATAPEPEQLLSAARSVGDQLVSLAYRHESRTNWIGLELLGERYWRLTPMAADLAGGYTGPALFLAQLAALTGVSRYAEAAREALAPVPGLLDALHGRADELGSLGSGAFAGLGLHRVRADRGGHAPGRPGGAGPGGSGRPAELRGERGRGRVRGARRGGGRARLAARGAPRDRPPGGLAWRRALRRADRRRPAPRLRGLRRRGGGDRLGAAALRRSRGGRPPPERRAGGPAPGDGRSGPRNHRRHRRSAGRNDRRSTARSAVRSDRRSAVRNDRRDDPRKGSRSGRRRAGLVRRGGRHRAGCRGQPRRAGGPGAVRLARGALRRAGGHRSARRRQPVPRGVGAARTPRPWRTARRTARVDAPGRDAAGLGGPGGPAVRDARPRTAPGAAHRALGDRARVPRAGFPDRIGSALLLRPSQAPLTEPRHSDPTTAF